MSDYSVHGIDSAEHLLLQRQLCWVGHVIRMPSNRLPRRVLYGELVNGQRLPGGPKLRYMDHIHRILNKCNISTAELEQLSTDRDTWKSACANGLATYNVSADQAAEDRHTRRHNPANPPTTCPRCPQCSRICASEFGLHSAQPSTESCLTSTSATLLAAQTSSSNSTDYCKQASSTWQMIERERLSEVVSMAILLECAIDDDGDDGDETYAEILRGLSLLFSKLNII